MNKNEDHSILLLLIILVLAMLLSLRIWKVAERDIRSSSRMAGSGASAPHLNRGHCQDRLQALKPGMTRLEAETLLEKTDENKTFSRETYRLRNCALGDLVFKVDIQFEPAAADQAGRDASPKNTDIIRRLSEPYLDFRG